MLNVIAIMGRLVADPELRTTPAGGFVLLVQMDLLSGKSAAVCASLTWG